jgi:hypothetical protein
MENKVGIIIGAILAGTFVFGFSEKIREEEEEVKHELSEKFWNDTGRALQNLRAHDAAIRDRRRYQRWEDNKYYNREHEDSLESIELEESHGTEETESMRISPNKKNIDEIKILVEKETKILPSDKVIVFGIDIFNYLVSGLIYLIPSASLIAMIRYGRNFLLVGRWVIARYRNTSSIIRDLETGIRETINFDDLDITNVNTDTRIKQILEDKEIDSRLKRNRKLKKSVDELKIKKEKIDDILQVKKSLFKEQKKDLGLQQQPFNIVRNEMLSFDYGIKDLKIEKNEKEKQLNSQINDLEEEEKNMWKIINEAEAALLENEKEIINEVKQKYNVEITKSEKENIYKIIKLYNDNQKKNLKIDTSENTNEEAILEDQLRLSKLRSGDVNTRQHSHIEGLSFVDIITVNENINEDINTSISQNYILQIIRREQSSSDFEYFQSRFENEYPKLSELIKQYDDIFTEEEQRTRCQNLFRKLFTTYSEIYKKYLINILGLLMEGQPVNIVEIISKFNKKSLKQLNAWFSMFEDSYRDLIKKSDRDKAIRINSFITSFKTMLERIIKGFIKIFLYDTTNLTINCKYFSNLENITAFIEGNIEKIRQLLLQGKITNTDYVHFINTCSSIDKSEIARYNTYLVMLLENIELTNEELKDYLAILEKNNIFEFNRALESASYPSVKNLFDIYK